MENTDYIKVYLSKMNRSTNKLTKIRTVLREKGYTNGTDISNWIPVTVPSELNAKYYIFNYTGETGSPYDTMIWFSQTHSIRSIEITNMIKEL